MKNKLNPKLWTDEVIKPDVADKLMQIARHFYDFLDIDAPIIDIRLTGSNCNYTYTPQSDIDLHIHIDISTIGCSDKNLSMNFLRAKKDLYNLQRNITIKNQKVELYCQDINQPHHSTCEYSLLFGKWIKRPKQPTINIDNSGVLRLTRIYQELIDNVDNLDDDKLKLDLATTIKNDVVKKRKEGLEMGGELSKENLLFKRLRNSGFDKLFKAISRGTDRELSLENQSRR